MEIEQKVSPEVARETALRAIEARDECVESLNVVLGMVSRFILCEENRTPDCGALTFAGGPTLPYCTACGWTLAPEGK